MLLNFNKINQLYNGSEWVAASLYAVGFRPCASTGIHGALTFGYGNLNFNGFWQFQIPDDMLLHGWYSKEQEARFGSSYYRTNDNRLVVVTHVSSNQEDPDDPWDDNEYVGLVTDFVKTRKAALWESPEPDMKNTEVIKELEAAGVTIP